MFCNLINITVLKTKVSVSPMFFAVLTMVLLFDKTGVSGYAVLFSIIHEIAHFLALLFTKTHPGKIEIDYFGIRILLPENMSTMKKIPVLTAGFTINFVLSALFFYLGKIVFACINLFIGLFTMLPLASTDGGEILKTILEEFFSQKAKIIFKTISVSFCAVISAILIFLAFYTKNFFLFIAVVYMIFCAMKKAA